MDFLNFVIGLSEGSGRAIAQAQAPRLRTLRGVVEVLSATV
jgi:acyl carrier protein